MSESKGTLPGSFDGSRSKAIHWLYSIESHFALNGDHYDTDEKKIRLALAKCSEGTARPWAESKYRIAQKIENYGTWEEFAKEFHRLFKPIDEGGTARARMWALKQKGSIDKYIAEFMALASVCGITEDTALIEFFARGLQPGILNRIAGLSDTPKTIQEWYEYAAHFEGSWMKAKVFSGNWRGGGNSFSYSSPSRPSRDSNAMDIEKLSIEQQQEYRKSGKCFGCGKTGHIRRNCPDRKNDGRKETNSTRLRALLSSMNEEEKGEARSILEDEGF